ncbi:MAG TPA: hypothetical protein PKH07_04495, partial [bacterium]|nr:hypothetical protein [bacterium]
MNKDCISTTNRKGLRALTNILVLLGLCIPCFADDVQQTGTTDFWASGTAEVSEASPEPKPGLQLTLSEAVLTALENNIAFQIERIRPEIRRTSEESELATFDPSIAADLTHSRGWTRDDIENRAKDDKTRDHSTTAGVSVGQFFPTGTSVQLGLDQTFRSSDASGSDSDRNTTNYDAS